MPTQAGTTRTTAIRPITTIRMDPIRITTTDRYRTWKAEGATCRRLLILGHAPTITHVRRPRFGKTKALSGKVLRPAIRLGAHLTRVLICGTTPSQLSRLPRPEVSARIPKAGHHICEFRIRAILYQTAGSRRETR